MNSINGDKKSGSPSELPKLSFPTQVVLWTAICLLTFLGAVGVLGLFGVVCTTLAAALSIVSAHAGGGTAKSLIPVLCANLAACVFVVLFSGTVYSLPAALYSLVMAAGIYFTLRAGMSRAVSVMAAAIPAAVLMFAAFGASIYAEFGALNAETINQTLDSIYAPIIEYYTALIAEISAESGLELAAIDVEALLYYTKTLLIGGVIAVMIAFAYFVTLTVRIVSDALGVGESLPCGVRIGMSAKITKDGPVVEISREPVKWRIELDSVSAGVYIGAYILSVLSAGADGMSVALAASENIVLILSPGFFYCGIRDVILGLRGKASIGKAGALLLVPAIILSLINPSTLIFLMCALGVIVTFRENRARRKINANGKEMK